MLDLMNSVFDDFYKDLSVKGNMPTDISETDNETFVRRAQAIIKKVRDL